MQLSLFPYINKLSEGNFIYGTIKVIDKEFLLRKYLNFKYYIHICTYIYCFDKIFI